MANTLNMPEAIVVYVTCFVKPKAPSKGHPKTKEKKESQMTGAIMEIR